MLSKLQLAMLVVAGLAALAIGLKFGSALRDADTQSFAANGPSGIPAGHSFADGHIHPGTEEPLQPFTFTDVNGDTISSKEWLGKPVLVNFWAPWCAPCREEIPLLNDAAARYVDSDLVVAGIAIDELETVRRFGDEVGIVYPSLVAGREAGYSLLETYNPDAQLPFSLMVDPTGRIIARKLGLLSAAEIAAWVRAAADPTRR